MDVGLLRLLVNSVGFCFLFSLFLYVDCRHLWCSGYLLVRCDLMVVWVDCVMVLFLGMSLGVC